MSTFSVPDMTCGHCVRSITEAIQAVAPQAIVSTDLEKHQVTVQGLDGAQALKVIEEAGYTPSAL
ncbi:heavy-metal-associated domain-containing protein [Alcaligenes faecalis]|uniref:heavy-metal-associated domain-containing protein n=1 Tax=Alcaligenes faecalis TaxID=511 RepID=UPI000E1B36F3|nr:heavy-metal-associated domain-containing protein [Alcaligenes faecalis]QRF91858.1 heavy metal transporter [Alcaligenes faecalis]ULH07482.1 heavy-metal-associated domain-containing protein [Alcaligenes faecalis]SSY76944.1 Copper-transporting P-type ATPase [Alcaligenes faecalis subsp. faecalis]